MALRVQKFSTRWKRVTTSAWAEENPWCPMNRGLSEPRKLSEGMKNKIFHPSLKTNPKPYDD